MKIRIRIKILYSIMTQICNLDKYAARKRYLQLVDVVSEVKITTADNVLEIHLNYLLVVVVKRNTKILLSSFITR